MKITREHHKLMPYLKRLTDNLTVEQNAVLESLLDLVYMEGLIKGEAKGRSEAATDKDFETNPCTMCGSPPGIRCPHDE